MNVSAAAPSPSTIPLQHPRPTRRKDADGDYDGPPKTASTPAPVKTPTTNGTLDTKL